MRKLVALCALAGLAMPTSSSAIVGGGLAAANEYPWAAAVYSGSSPSNGQFCGGTLVGSDVVVTAAHCVDDLLSNTAADLPLDPFRTRDPLGLRLKVMVGSNVLSASRGEHRYVRRVTTHPSSAVDISVLELEEPVATAPIDGLVRAASDAALDAPGIVATVVGWGATSEGGAGSNALKEAEVPIISDIACNQNYSGRVNSATEICAGYPEGGTDTCQGDSGGPFAVANPDGGWLLAGATSWGQGCARPNRPGVYAEMRAAAAFIDGFLD